MDVRIRCMLDLSFSTYFIAFFVAKMYIKTSYLPHWSWKAWSGDFVQCLILQNVNNFILDWFQHWNKATFYWCSKVIVIQGDWIVWIDNLGLKLIRPSRWPSYDVLTRNTLLQGSIRIKQIMQNLNFHFYHPPTKLREGNVLHLFVIPFTRGVYDITSCLAASSHVLFRGIWCHFLSGCLVPCFFCQGSIQVGPPIGGFLPGGGLPPGEFPSRGRSPPGVWHYPPPPMLLISSGSHQAGNTHPTGMYSC